MSNISQIDRNFAVETSLDIDGIRFYDIEEEVFSLYGVTFENGVFLWKNLETKEVYKEYKI